MQNELAVKDVPDALVYAEIVGMPRESDAVSVAPELDFQSLPIEMLYTTKNAHGQRTRVTLDRRLIDKVGRLDMMLEEG